LEGTLRALLSMKAMRLLIAAIFAVTTLLATFGHPVTVRTAQGQMATLTQIALALPDGTLPEWCETNPDGTPKTLAAASHCEFCRLIEASPASVPSAPSGLVVAGAPILPVAIESPQMRLVIERPPGRAPPSTARVRA